MTVEELLDVHKFTNAEVEAAFKAVDFVAAVTARTAVAEGKSAEDLGNEMQQVLPKVQKVFEAEKLRNGDIAMVVLLLALSFHASLKLEVLSNSTKL